MIRKNKKVEDLRGEGLMTNPNDFRSWWKIMFRTWRPHLTPTEFLFVQFIFDRTVSWGKVSEFITTRQFVEGIYDNKNCVVCEGLGVSDRTVRRTTSALERLGLLTKTEVKGNVALLYSLNYEWNPMSLRQSKKEKELVSGLRTPKNKAKREDTHDRRGRTPVSGGEDTHDRQTSIINNTKNITINRSNTGQPPYQSAEDGRQDLINKVKGKGRVSRDRKIANFATGSYKPSDVSALWSKLMSDRYEGNKVTAPLTNIDASILCRSLKSVGKINKGMDIVAYMGWLISDWDAIRVECFGWMTEYPSPENPVVKFIVKHTNTLLTAYDKREFTKNAVKQTPYDRRVATLRRSGSTDDEARATADKEFAVKDELASLRHERRLAEAREKRLDARESELVKPKGSTARERRLKYRDSAKGSSTNLNTDLGSWE